MIEYPYPKTVNLLPRDPDTHGLVAGYRDPIHAQVGRWLATEKVDGTNVRVCLEWEVGWGWGDARFVVEGTDVTFCPVITVRGRTDAAPLPGHRPGKDPGPGSIAEWAGTDDPRNGMLALWRSLGLDTLEYPVDVVAFGEGYGPGIKKAGAGYRREGHALRLFDVVTLREGRPPLWRPWSDVELAARCLGVRTVPAFGPMTAQEIVGAVQRGFRSIVATEDGNDPRYAPPGEGVVARTDPYLYVWDGRPVRWKLKTRDLEPGVEYLSEHKY